MSQPTNSQMHDPEDRRTAEEALADVTQDIQQQEQKAEERERALEEAVPRATLARRWILGGAAMVILLANYLIYPQTSIHDSVHFDPAGEPEVSALFLQAALNDYADDHNGTYPEELTELIEEGYLGAQEVRREDLAQFGYTRESPETYQLIPPGYDVESDEDLVLTSGWPGR